jgi:hypothetical protein
MSERCKLAEAVWRAVGRRRVMYNNNVSVSLYPEIRLDESKKYAFI